MESTTAYELGRMAGQRGTEHRKPLIQKRAEHVSRTLHVLAKRATARGDHVKAAVLQKQAFWQQAARYGGAALGGAGVLAGANWLGNKIWGAKKPGAPGDKGDPGTPGQVGADGKPVWNQNMQKQFKQFGFEPGMAGMHRTSKMMNPMMGLIAQNQQRNQMQRYMGQAFG